MPRILLFGKFGQLGWELRRTLAPLGEVITLDYPEVDFTKITDLRDRVIDIKPNAIINAIAYTAVDRAESEVESCRLVNAAAPAMLAEVACKQRASLIHYSTDYVFDGKKGTAYSERDQTNPLNVYGQTKLEGERAIQEVGGAYLIFRTSWVYSMRKAGFVSKVLQWAREHEVMRVVHDQVSNPTWARMLAEISSLIFARSQPDSYQWFLDHQGLYHLAGDGCGSRYEWAEEVIKLDPYPQQQKVKTLEAAKSEDFPTPAARPMFSALDCKLFKETFNLQIPDWRVALRLALELES